MMRIYPSMIGAIFCLLSCAAAQEVPERTAQVERGTHCHQSYRDPSKDECEIPLIGLVSDPHRYEGVNVSTTGYLRRVQDVLVLFPSRDVYIFSAGRGGIELLGAPTSVAELLHGRSECSRAVTVQGGFTAKVSGRLPGSIGVIHGDIRAFAEEVPGTPPRRDASCIK